MYTATMRYVLKAESFGEFCRIWEADILAQARTAPGFVRMQLLAANPEALAIGTWKEKQYAEKFMQTGVFKKLMEKITPLLVSQPAPELWNLAAYAEGRL